MSWQPVRLSVIVSVVLAVTSFSAVTPRADADDTYPCGPKRYVRVAKIQNLEHGSVVLVGRKARYMCSPAAQWIQAVGPQVKVRIRPGTPIRMLQHYSDGTWSAGPRIRPKQLKSWHWKDYPDKPAWKLDRFFKLFGENKLRPSKVKQQFIS